jgi:hypothetical protein
VFLDSGFDAHSAQARNDDVGVDPNFKPKSPRTARAFVQLCQFENPGAGEGIRTLDPDLGKVVLYH